METYRFSSCRCRSPTWKPGRSSPELAATGSFAAAAKELAISKATVSKAITRLETRLGTPLVNRTSRRLSLTEIGRASVSAAGGILAEAEILEAQAMAQSATPRGTVRVAAPMSFGTAYLAPALPDLLAQYPQLSIDLHLSDEVIDLIGGRFDLALRIAALPNSSLRARRFCDVRRLLVAAPAYLERRGRPSHPRDLGDHACLGYAYLPVPNRWRFIHGSGEEFVVTRSDPRCLPASAWRSSRNSSSGPTSRPAACNRLCPTGRRP